MRNIFLLAAVLALPSFCLAAQDCGKNADACTDSRPVSPFVAASRAGSAPQARPAAKTAPAPVKTSALLPAAAQPAAPQQAPAQAEAAPAAAPAAAGSQGAMASPGWLLFVAAGVTGLYFYLRGGARKGKRK